MSDFKIVKTKMFSVQITPEDAGSGQAGHGPSDGCYFHSSDAFYVWDMKDVAGVLANYPHEIRSVWIDSVYVSNYEMPQKSAVVETGADDAGC